MTELEAASQKEKEASKLKEIRKGQDDRGADDSETETEGAGNQSEGLVKKGKSEELLKPDDSQGNLRKRSSVGEASSEDLSTDSEWDKVEEAGDMVR